MAKIASLRSIVPRISGVLFSRSLAGYGHLVLASAHAQSSHFRHTPTSYSGSPRWWPVFRPMPDRTMYVGPWRSILAVVDQLDIRLSRMVVVRTLQWRMWQDQ